MGKAVSRTFTSAQTGTLLIAVPDLGSLRIEGVIFTAAAGNASSPSMSVSLGGNKVVEHPGVPAGGGLVATGLNITEGQGDDLTFDCSGGTVSVSVIYG